MNRAQRRSLKRTVAHAMKSGPGLAHPVPDSVALSGGPMDGWIVKPDAPALDPDWRAKWIEESARGAYERAQLKQPSPRSWADAVEADRHFYREVARSEHGGAGHYQLAPGGKTAAWVAE